MMYRAITLITYVLFSTASCNTEINDVDKLLEQASHAKTPEEKKELIGQLKKVLADKNKKTQEKADAIKKAKKKLPIELYNDKSQETHE